MRTRLSDRSLLPELRRHFVRFGFVISDAGDGAIEVQRPDAPNREQSEREIMLHLSVWRALHPGSIAEPHDL